ncbi:hypothetical protein CYN39_004603 [Salmonella enterica subsp. enterica serovar Newport]|nr:hypothetical protein [Salmonella enterica]
MTILIEQEYLKRFNDFYEKAKPSYDRFISYVFDSISDLVDEALTEAFGNNEDAYDQYRSSMFNNEVTLITPVLHEFIKEKYFTGENTTSPDYIRSSKISIEDERIYKEEFNKILDVLIDRRNKELKDEFEKMTNYFIMEKIDAFLHLHLNGKNMFSLNRQEALQRENLYKVEYFALRKIFEDIFDDRINKKD